MVNSKYEEEKREEYVIGVLYADIYEQTENYVLNAVCVKNSSLGQ